MGSAMKKAANQSCYPAGMVLETPFPAARIVNMEVVLVVPGIVDSSATYEECYERSLDEIANLTSFACDHGITIGIWCIPTGSIVSSAPPVICDAIRATS